MRSILSLAHRGVLEESAWSNVLLAFDYDGTLAPIVSDPQEATMRKRTRQLLAAAAKLYPTIVISGRSQADVQRRLAGVAVQEVVGNHGIEPRHATRPYREEVQRWRPILAAHLERHQGVAIENKTFSLAVHYRRSREKKKARAAIARAVASLGEVRVIGGKQVVNILPLGAPHKGVALERERSRLGCDTAIYVGDDETDEDVFALDQPGRILSIRVGAHRSSAADYCIDSQQEIDRLLKLLCELREAARVRQGAAR